MAFGFAIRNSSGRLWMSPNVTPMNLIERLTLTASRGAIFTTSVPTHIPIIIFVRYSEKALAYCLYQKEISGFHAYELNGGTHYGEGGSTHEMEHYQPCPMTVYVFAAMAKKTSRYGLDIYNALGKLVYSAQMKPLQLFHYQTNHQSAFDIDMREPVAVVPMLYAQIVEWSHMHYNLSWFDTDLYWTGAFGNKIYSALTMGYSQPYFDGNDAHSAYESSSLSGFFYIKTAIYDK